MSAVRWETVVRCIKRTDLYKSLPSFFMISFLIYHNCCIYSFSLTNFIATWLLFYTYYTGHSKFIMSLHIYFWDSLKATFVLTSRLFSSLGWTRFFRNMLLHPKNDLPVQLCCRPCIFQRTETFVITLHNSELNIYKLSTSKCTVLLNVK